MSNHLLSHCAILILFLYCSIGIELHGLFFFKGKINEQRIFLEKYYDGSEVLIGALGLQPDQQEYFAGIEFIAHKMARALVWQDKFIISAMGSGITSGAMNCNYDSYEKQLERLLTPLWNIVNVNFEVRNAGIGGRCHESYHNKIWCMSHALGNDTDIAHYSWSYFEPDRKWKSEEDPTIFHEMFIRWALLMDKSPAAHFLNVGAKRDNKMCRKSLDSKDPNANKLFDKYGKFGVNILCLRPGIRKRGYVRKDREESDCGDDCIGKFGDGLHNITRYGESDSVSAVRKRSLGFVYRNWHPGPLGYQVISDSFGYYYMEAMLKAIELIETSLQTQGLDQLKVTWPQKPIHLTLNEIQQPEYCNMDICNLDTPPVCLDLDEPTFGVSQIKISGFTEKDNSYYPDAELSNREWKTGRIVGPSSSIPDAEKHMLKCAHLDFCGGITPIDPLTNGSLTFKLPPIKLGRIIVCFSSPTNKEKINEIISKILFLVDGLPIDVKKNGKVLWRKCIELQKKHPDINSRDQSKEYIFLAIRIDFKQITTSVGISSVFAI